MSYGIVDSEIIGRRKFAPGACMTWLSEAARLKAAAWQRVWDGLPGR
jgi:hypothetical protein